MVQNGQFSASNSAKLERNGVKIKQYLNCFELFFSCDYVLMLQYPQKIPIGVTLRDVTSKMLIKSCISCFQMVLDWPYRSICWRKPLESDPGVAYIGKPYTVWKRFSQATWSHRFEFSYVASGCFLNEWLIALFRGVNESCVLHIISHKRDLKMSLKCFEIYIIGE